METILMKSSLLKESVMTPQWLWENLKRFCSGIKCPLLILFRWEIYSYWLQSPHDFYSMFKSTICMISTQCSGVQSAWFLLVVPGGDSAWTLLRPQQQMWPGHPAPLLHPGACKTGGTHLLLKKELSVLSSFHPFFYSLYSSCILGLNKNVLL